MSVHLPLAEPISIAVRKDYLYDGDTEMKGWVNGKIIEFLSYDDSVLTVTVLLADGAVFYHLPLHALVIPNPPLPRWREMTECYYQNVGRGPVEMFRNPILALKPCHVFLKGKQDHEPLRGTYLYTFDWVTDNLLMHLVLLDTGHLVCFPPHKILFGQTNPKALPDYHKSHLDFDFRKVHP